MSDKYASVQDAVKYMENAYDRGGKYLVDGRPRYTAHAVRLEDETGLKGIAGRYQFINGQEPAFAEYGYRKRFLKYAIAAGFLKSEDPICRQAGETLKDQLPAVLKEINQELEELTKLNPELKGLNNNKNNLIETYRTLIGVTSQYNVDDINAYLHNMRTGSKNFAVLDRAEKIKKATGIRFGWQPSAKTMDKIEQQLAMRQVALLQAKSR